MDNNQARVQQMLRSRRAGDAQGRAALKKPAAVVPQRDNAAGGNWRSGLVYAYPPGAGVLGDGRGGVGIVLHYRRDTGGYKSLNANDVRLTPLKTQGVKRVFLKFLKQKALPLDLVKHIFSLPVDNLQPAHVERWMAMIAIGGGPGASVRDVQQYLLEIRKKLLSRQGVADIAYQIFRSITDLRASMSGFLNIQGLYAQVSPEYHFAAVLGDLMKMYLDLERLFWVKKTLVNLKGGGLLERAQAWEYTFKKNVDCPTNGDVIAAFGAALSKNTGKKNAYNKHLEGGEFARLKKYSQRVGEVLAQLVRYFGAKYDGAKSKTNTKLNLALELKQLISRTRLLQHPMYRICGGFEALQADTGVLPALRQLMVQSGSEVSSEAAMAAVATQYVRGAKNTCVAWPVAPKNGNGKRNGKNGNGKRNGKNGNGKNGNGKNGATQDGSQGPAPNTGPPPGGGGNTKQVAREQINQQGGSGAAKNNDYVTHSSVGGGCFLKAIGYDGKFNENSLKKYFNSFKNKKITNKLSQLVSGFIHPTKVIEDVQEFRGILRSKGIKYVVGIRDDTNYQLSNYQKDPLNFIKSHANISRVLKIDSGELNEGEFQDALNANKVITFVSFGQHCTIYAHKGVVNGTAKTANKNAAGASSNRSGNARGSQGSAQAPVANLSIGSSGSSCRCESSTDRGKNNETYVIHRVSGECNDCFFYVVMKALGYVGQGTLKNAQPYLRLLNATKNGFKMQARVEDKLEMHDPLHVLACSSMSRKILFFNNIRYVVRIVVAYANNKAYEQQYKNDPIQFLRKLPETSFNGINYFEGIRLDSEDGTMTRISRDELPGGAFEQKQVITFVLQNCHYSVFLPKGYNPRNPFEIAQEIRSIEIAREIQNKTRVHINEEEL